MLAENLAQGDAQNGPRMASKWSLIIVGGNLANHPTAGCEFQASVDRSGLAGPVLSSLVPGWPVPRRAHLRL